nr:helix-turn-helix domain-containing protein [Halovenus carboxidivorans]
MGRVFEEYPSVQLTLDCVVPTGDTMLPYFWISAPEEELSEILSLLETVTEVRSVELLDTVDGEGLFEIDWRPDHLGLLEALARCGITVLSADGSAHGWLFELRSTDRAEFASFQRHCQRLGVPVSLVHISDLSELNVGTVNCLTPPQREALELAYREGYYDDPRGATLAALAEELDISRQALSDRLRRGYRTLIKQGLLHHDPRDS